MIIDIKGTSIQEVIENCETIEDDKLIAMVCPHCPLVGACLQFWTGDKSKNK